MQVRRDYLLTAVKVLTNSPKISHITKRDIFQVSFPQSDEKYDKSAVCRFHKCLGSYNMLTFGQCSETALFKDWSNQVFRSLQFREYISYEDHHLFQNV